MLETLGHRLPSLMIAPLVLVTVQRKSATQLTDVEHMSTPRNPTKPTTAPVVLPPDEDWNKRHLSLCGRLTLVLFRT
jgi:hypothetical protein